MTEKAKRLFKDFVDELLKSRDRKLVEIISHLKNWTPIFTPEQFNNNNDFYDLGDENAPFFSEAYLYTLLGKDDARTLLAFMKPIWELAGLKK